MPETSRCLQWRNSGAIQEALRHAVRPERQTRQCAGQRVRVGESCVVADDPSDSVANAFRCNLACLQPQAQTDALRAFYAAQCEVLGDASCTFAHLDCTAVADLMRKGPVAPPSPSAADAEAHAEADRACAPIGGNVRTQALALSFRKTHMLQSATEGARVALRPSGLPSDSTSLGFDPVAFDAGRSNPIVQATLLPPTLSDADQDRYAGMLARRLPILTSLHDLCCGTRPGTTLLSRDVFDEEQLREEVDKLAELVDRMDDGAYDPLQQCPDGTPVTKHCPALTER